MDAFEDWRRRRRFARAWRRVCFPPTPAQFSSFGEGSVIAPPARITSPGWVSIGAQTLIHEHVFLAVTRQADGPEPSLEIGNRVRIGRFVQISVTGCVVIEDDVVISDEVHIGDTFHGWSVPGLSYVDQPLTTPDPVFVRRGALVNFGAVVLPGVTIGVGACVQPGAVVTHDVAPGALVLGAPARPVPPADACA